jgi:hypothetical protein
VLGSDSLEGRATGSAGGKKAAAYIVKHLQESGLQPAGYRKSFYQTFPVHASLPLQNSRLRLINDTITDLRLWTDYVLYNSGTHTIIPEPLQLVFAGYGINAPEYDYNDYSNLDIVNKIVVFLAGEPLSDDPEYFDGSQLTIHSDANIKFRTALARGARGCILIPLQRHGNFSDWSRTVRMFMFEDIKLPYGINDNVNILINQYSAHHLFRGSPYSFDDILKQDSLGTIHSFQLSCKASFTGSFDQRILTTSNVAGIIPGSDILLKNEYLLIVAHYDHLGIGIPVAQDSIYNGVIDNAIGVSAALELARVLNKAAGQLSRSILFLFVTGEENGLLGSRYYCEHPLIPLHQTIAVLNIDGIGVIDEFNSITGIGSELSTLGTILQQVADQMQLRIDPVPLWIPETEPLTSSDQFSFISSGIPAILIMEGLDYRNMSDESGFQRFVKWGRQIYHSPMDDLSQPINYKAVRQHTQVLFTFAHTVTNTYITPQWSPGSQFINARLQTIAEQR